MPLVESHHWWDDPEYDDVAGEEGKDAFEDLRNPSVTTAGREFAEMLVQMRMSSRLTAKEVCVLAFWATRSKGDGACRGASETSLSKVGGALPRAC